jgi:ABC-type transporter Mla subunit MlaD
MSTQRNALNVGIVSVIVLAMFFGILMWISQRVSGAMQSVTIRFKSTPDMPTLGEGSDVLVGGQKVGKVRSADLQKQVAVDSDTGQKAEQFFVVVVADIKAFLDLRADCKVTAEGPPLGGDGIVKIDLGHSPDPLPKGAVIEGAPPGGFGAILASLQDEFNADNPNSLLGQIKMQLDPEARMSLMAKLLQSFSDVNAITASLNRQLTSEDKATLLAKIQNIADNANAATSALRDQFAADNPELLLGKINLAMDTLNEGLATLARVLKTNEPVINRTLTSVETAAGNVASQTDAARPDSLMAEFKLAGQTLTKTLADIQTVTGTTREIVVLNRENINRMLANFKEASDHVKTGMKYVLRHPWRLLNAPPPAEVKQQAIFDAARNFAEAATRIDDAAGQLRALADLHNGAIPSDSPDLARLEADLKLTQDKYRRAEAELWRLLGVQ